MIRQSLIFCLIFVLLATVASGASEWRATSQEAKSDLHLGLNPGLPDGREGGEDAESAFPILALPFYDTGNTSDNLDNYSVTCPYGTTSLDVVYVYIPTENEIISTDLCGSLYDTQIYVLDSALSLVECNDDYYNDDQCGTYTSFIEQVFLEAGEVYYIVVDGYGGDTGDYILNVIQYLPPEPCYLDCGDDENEPAIVDGYLDDFNGGCNNPEFGNPFSIFEGDATGELTHCGQGGWFVNSEGWSSRDTDWYTAIIGNTGIIEWTLDAEQESYGYLLSPQDCEFVAVLDQILVGPCESLTMVIEGVPGELVWLWVGASEYSQPQGVTVQEYSYLSHFTGLMGGTVTTDQVTFDSIKSLYRYFEND